MSEPVHTLLSSSVTPTRKGKRLAALIAGTALAATGIVAGAQPSQAAPKPNRRGSVAWTLFGGSVRHEAVFPAPDRALARGVSWATPEPQAIPLSGPGIDQTLLGPVASAIQTNHQIGDPVGASVVGATVYADTNTHRVLALSALTGRIKWMTRTLNATMTNPLVAAGRVVVGFGDAGFQFGQLPPYAKGAPVVRGYGFSGLEALSATTGRVRWQVPTFGEVMATPVVVGNHVVFATGGGHIEAVDLATGALVWKTSVGSFTNMDGLNLWRSPSGVTEVLVGGTDPGALYAVNAATGAILWKTAPAGLGITGLAEASPAVAPRHGLVIDEATVNRTATAATQVVFAVNAATGAIAWETTLGTGALPPPFKGSSAALVHGGLVFLDAPVLHQLVALNLRTGVIDWRSPLTGTGHGAPVAVGNRLLFANGPAITTVRAATGAPIATTTIGGAFGVVDPVVVGRTMVVTNGWGWVLALPLSRLKA